jgi:hypothetical protein
MTVTMSTTVRRRSCDAVKGRRRVV